MRWIHADLSLAFRIPEIRGLVLRAYALRWARLILAFLLLLPAIPLVVLSLVAKGVDDMAEKAIWLLQAPTRKLHARYRDRRAEIHAIMPVEEIRRRLHGEAA